MSSYVQKLGHRRVLVLSLALLLLLGVVPATAAPNAPDRVVLPGSPGASGIGDPYYPRDGNGGYDVRHYAIHDTYRPRSGLLTGTTVIRAVAHKRLSRFNLDLLLAVDGVRVNGRPAAWRKDGRHELVLTPARPLPRHRPFTVRVRYHGVPKDLSVGPPSPFVSTPRETLAVNQPHMATWWFAANDHPADKATFLIDIAVPRGTQVISNGRLLDRTRRGGVTHWRWQMRDPMVPYLAFFAAGRFTVETGVRRGLPFTLAVSRQLAPRAQRVAMRLLRRTPGIVRWLAGEYGRYPFGSTGGLVTGLSLGFALENQTRPVYPFLGQGPGAVSVVVHELAHQWFGDDVALRRWRDMWLNEGFATFVEWRYDEAHGGRSAQRALLTNYTRRPAGVKFWRLRIANPGPHRIFAGPVYVRGAMTMQALRHRIGDPAHQRLLRRWARVNAGGHGSTRQLQRLAEQASGQQLDRFFDVWLRTTRKPARTAANGLR